jgi:hypothetical protein
LCGPPPELRVSSAVFEVRGDGPTGHVGWWETVRLGLRCQFRARGPGCALDILGGDAEKVRCDRGFSPGEHAPGALDRDLARRCSTNSVSY